MSGVTFIQAGLNASGTNAAVDSETTVTLLAGDIQHITGVTTITDIDFSPAYDGAMAWAIFDGALTLTNSSSLKLPGAANIVTAAGDRALFYQDSGDNVICLAYVHNDGTAVISPAAATAAEIYAATATDMLTPANAAAAGAEVALTDAATVAINMSNGINFGFTIGGNRVLGLPSNMSGKVGRTGRIRITQDGTGSRTLAYASGWKFPSATAPVLTTTASAVDYLYYEVLSSSTIWGSLNKDIR